jgi:Ca-activated chloride channel family protein
MDLLWPGALLLWGLLPVLAVIYWLILRRRRRFALRYSSLALIREALPRPSRLRRHLPFALLLIALFSLTFALSRPVSIVSLPTNRTTIILTIDVSRSMCSTDIAPNRLVAAERAALSFIQSQQAGTQIGVVAFAGFAELIQPPTNDQELLEAAVESLTTGRRTAIGSGILKAIDAIAEVDPSVAPSTNDDNSESSPPPVPRGAYVPNIIVLLTDGVSNAGIMPEDAAQQAVDRGVRVYTIGFGTADGSAAPNCSPQFQGREPFGGGPQFGGGGGFGGGGFRRGIDEATLREVAEMTGGEYYSAESSTELHDVFQNLPTYLIMKHETTEITVLFAAFGALLAALAVGLSLLWHPLP